MTSLPDLQLQELSSQQRGMGDGSPGAYAPYPTAPCWEFALSGEPGRSENITPPLIFENALQLNNYGEVQGIKGTFKNWVTDEFNNRDADALVTILERNLPVALAWDEDAQTLCREAFARLCIIARVAERD